MSLHESQIQIEQRIPRCARCGKLINLRGEYLEEPTVDRSRLLFCSRLCRDEHIELAPQSAPEEAQ